MFVALFVVVLVFVAFLVLAQFQFVALGTLWRCCCCCCWWWWWCALLHSLSRSLLAFSAKANDINKRGGSETPRHGNDRQAVKIRETKCEREI